MQLQRRPSGLPDWLYVAIVAALGLYFIIGAIAWAIFICNGVAVPDSFTTILATIAGGLVGVLAPLPARLAPLSPGERSGHRQRPSSTRRTRRVVRPSLRPRRAETDAVRWRQDCCWVMLTIQGMPNLSVHMPNSSPHICFSRGMVTVPPSDSFSQ